MKKIFSFFLALIAVMAVNARQVVFDFTNPAAMGIAVPETGKGTDLTNPQNIVVDDVTMTSTQVAKTATRIWNYNGACELRIYTNSTLKFACSEAITAVEFAGSAVSFSEFAGMSWVGNATEITFTASANSKISSITLTIGEAADVWVPDTIGVMEARALIAANDAHDHFVKGIVASDVFNSYNSFDGKVSFYMIDHVGDTDSLQAYQVAGVGNQKFASLEAAQDLIRLGDTVLVYAQSLSLYTDKNIYEIAAGNYVETLGQAPRGAEYDLTVNAGVAEIDDEDVLELTLSNGDDAVFEYMYQLTQGTAIAGEYTITEDNPAVVHYNGAEIEVTGSLKIVFVSAPVEGDFTYRVVLNVVDEEGAIYKADAQIVLAGTSVCVNDLNTITCALAKQIGMKLESNQVTEQTYKVYGYYAKFAGKFAYSKTGDYAYKQTFYMTDTKGSTYGDFEAYQVLVQDHDIDSIKPGDFVCVTCVIKRFTNTIENGNGATCEIVDPATVGFIRDVEPIETNVAGALAAGVNLADNASTDDPYRVIGYVTGFNQDEEGNMFWYMVDEYAEGVQGELKAYKCTTKNGYVPQDGDHVAVVGKLKKYQGVIEIDHGVATNLDAAQAIPEVMMEESHVKAVKVLDNGQLFILRNGVKYNVQGAVLK